MRPRFAWGIVIAGALIGVGGGCLLAMFPRADRVVVGEMIEPPPGYTPAEPLSFDLQQEVGVVRPLGAWRRNTDNGFMALRIDPSQPQPPIDDRFADGFARAFLRRFLAEDIRKKSRIDEIAGRRVAHVDIDLDGHTNGKIRVRCAGMLIAGRIVVLVGIQDPGSTDSERAFDATVDNVARLSDKAPIDRAVLARDAGFGLVAITFPALMVAVFVTARRRDAWQRDRARQSAKAAAQ